MKIFDVIDCGGCAPAVLALVLSACVTTEQRTAWVNTNGLGFRGQFARQQS